MYLKVYIVLLLVCLVHSFFVNPRKHINEVQIQTRLGFLEGDPSEGDSELCRSVPVYVDPKTKKIVQKEHAKPGEWIEGLKCENEGGSCALSFPGYSSKCVQKYSYKILLDKNTGNSKNVEYRIPGGCVCSYKKI